MPSISPLANQFASTVAQFGLRKEADSHSRFWIWCGICWIGNLGPSTLQTLCDGQFWAKRFILRSSSCIRKLRALRQTRASLNTRKTLSTCKVNRLNSTTTSMARHFQLRFNKVMQAHRRNPQISKKRSGNPTRFATQATEVFATTDGIQRGQANKLRFCQPSCSPGLTACPSDLNLLPLQKLREVWARWLIDCARLQFCGAPPSPLLIILPVAYSAQL